MDPRLEDHAVGLELQIVELEERRKRAETQGRTDVAVHFQQEIESLQSELANTADLLAS
jgi:hypothetical protein